MISESFERIAAALILFPFCIFYIHKMFSSFWRKASKDLFVADMLRPVKKKIKKKKRKTRRECHTGNLGRDEILESSVHF